jgi:hypothetical protein
MVGEVLLLAGLFLLYRTGRLLVTGHAPAAFDHARQVTTLERWFQLDTETGLQHLVLPHRLLVRGLNEYYVHAHLATTAVWLVATYAFRRSFFPRARWVLIALTATALVIHLVYPLAPPRMLPGFVDTVATYGPAYYGRSDVASVANQFAAMPSLHFGWAVVVAWGVIRSTRSSWRYLAAVHPALTLLAITATGNHYWMDSLVASALVAMAVVVTGPRLRAELFGTPGVTTPLRNGDGRVVEPADAVTKEPARLP